MKIIYHLKDAPKLLDKNEFGKKDLQSILLDLFYSDLKRMGKRCKVHILEPSEYLEYSQHRKVPSARLEQCVRTLYLWNKHTTICEYKKLRRKSNDKTNYTI